MKYVTGASTTDIVSAREETNKELAYVAALEGIVLLENNGVLPLQNRRIALFGAGGKFTIKGGTGSGEVNERHSFSIYEGLVANGFTISNISWWTDYEVALKQSELEYKKKVKINIFNFSRIIDTIGSPFQYPFGRDITIDDIEESNTDTALYVVARQSGEGGDRKLDKGEFNLSPQEIQHLRMLASHYKKTVLIINSGAMIDLSPLDEIKIDALIFYCQQGMEGGRALASLLEGSVNFSAKLSDSWAKKYSDIPFGDQYSYLNGNTKEECYHEGIYVGYRYFDSFKVAPRYPFGYGLSYTNFNLETLNMYLSKTNFNIEVKVTNCGKYSGAEVVQLYVSSPTLKLTKEFQSLAAFSKTKNINSGENEVIKLTINLSDLASYDTETSSYILEKGTYLLRLGNSSRSTKIIASIMLDQTVITRRVKNFLSPQKQFVEIKQDIHNVVNTTEGFPSFTLSSSQFETLTIDYLTKALPFSDDVQEILNKLSSKEMIEVIVGTGMKAMFRVTKILTPGAVGHTTDKLIRKGLIGVNLSDGPSGLRILRRSAVRGRNIKMVDYVFGFMNHFPNIVKRFLDYNPKRDQIIYQYATAFPVGTSLAQTWNVDLIERVGKAISGEMNEFKITYYLAPAMNIHRNPLCGRNFEYYSEDPFLSGKIGAAVTRGVQSVEGNYATIKHFACNNQEDNRNRSNSVLSERALREIYLRGFEIAVKEAHPKAVMSSYNLINGVYTPNSYDLLTNILRKEWGFAGIVMTDWFSTGKGLAKNDIAIKSGNDMIMPGTNKAKRDIYRALKKGTLTKAELALACGNIINQIINSNVVRSGK